MSIPELRKENIQKTLLGSLAGSGTLGLLIPPSIILTYGVTVQESIAKLIAGIIPGS